MGQRSVNGLFSSASWMGVDGEGFIVALDLYSQFCASWPELTMLVQPLRDIAASPSRLLNLVTELKTSLQAAVVAALVCLVRGVRNDATEIADNATVAVLTR
jgi:hypothetical protein